MEENVCDYTPQEKKQMCISEEDKALIASSCKWAKFLAIIGFVMVGLTVLCCLMILLGIAVAGIAIPGIPDPSFTKVFITVMVLAVLIMLVYFLPIFYLYRHAVKGLKAVKTEDGLLMTESFLNLKRFFKFVGIFTIVVILLYIFTFIISFAAGFSGAMQGMPHMPHM